MSLSLHSKQLIFSTDKYTSQSNDLLAEGFGQCIVCMPLSKAPGGARDGYHSSSILYLDGGVLMWMPSIGDIKVSCKLLLYIL
jgi:hypothetical protein